VLKDTKREKNPSQVFDQLNVLGTFQSQARKNIQQEMNKKFTDGIIAPIGTTGTKYTTNIN
jgi:hypothetical protein